MTAPTPRNFNNTASTATLVSPVSSSGVSFQVDNYTNFPPAPFSITIDRNTPSEEIALVTQVLGTTLTVTRGYDATAAQAHLAGATVEHTAVARDFRESNQHVLASNDVHGASGSVVGTEGGQTLVDKTLTSPLLQASPDAGDAAVLWVPPSAPGRNLARGMNAAGTDVLVVDGQGNTTARNIHATGTLQVDGAAQFVGGITQTGGSSSLKATTVTGLTNTGNETVTGTLAVTGATTLTSVAVSGTATKAGVNLATETFATGAASSAVAAAGTAGVVNGELVRRDASGNFRSTRIYADQAPNTIDELTRKDYVDQRVTLAGQWITVLMSDTSYFWVPSGTQATMPGMDYTVNVGAGRFIEWEATIPIQHVYGGFIHSMMLLNGVSADSATVGGDNNVWAPAKLHGYTNAPAGGGLVRCQVQGWLQSGGGDFRAAPAFGVRLAYRIW